MQALKEILRQRNYRPNRSSFLEEISVLLHEVRALVLEPSILKAISLRQSKVTLCCLLRYSHIS